MPIMALIVMTVFISFVFFLKLSISKKKATLYQADLTTLRSIVSFKPRLGHTFIEREGELLGLLAAQLNQHSDTVNGLIHEPNTSTLVISCGPSDYQLTLLKLDKYPEEWALRIEQKFKHGLSAPHESSQTRKFLTTTQELLQQLPVGTVRWHKRQDWERGQTDIWSYHPY